MNAPWYIFSSVALIAAAIQYLLMKVALNREIRNEALLFYGFGGQFLVLLVLNVSTLNILLKRFDFHLYLLWGLLVAAFSFVGNLLYVYSVKSAPNPGYPDAINSANALVTFIAAILFFNAQFSLPKFVGCVLVSMGIVNFFMEKEYRKNKKWICQALGAMAMISGMFLAVKQMANLEYNPQQILLILTFFVTLGYGILLLASGSLLTMNCGSVKVVIFPLVFYIAFNIIANLSNFWAIEISPNLGYAQAIMNSQAVIVTIISPILFTSQKGGEFSIKKWLSVALIAVGLTLII